MPRRFLKLNVERFSEPHKSSVHFSDQLGPTRSGHTNLLRNCTHLPFILWILSASASALDCRTPFV